MQMLSITEKKEVTILQVFHFENNKITKKGPHQNDQRIPPMKPHIFEGKYELDSILSFLKLSNLYFLHTQDLTCFVSNDGASQWKKAVSAVLQTLLQEQKPSRSFGVNDYPYYFQRLTYVSSDSLYYEGRGPFFFSTSHSPLTSSKPTKTKMETNGNE